ncbi:MAG: hypothetical protein ACJAVK_001704 [Akkermansiaceae bacterium]|jgi:hypothetical protein
MLSPSGHRDLEQGAEESRDEGDDDFPGSVGQALEGVERRRALESALHGWAEEDPAAAAQYVGQLPISAQNLNLVHEMARRWAEGDQNAAVA